MDQCAQTAWGHTGQNQVMQTIKFASLAMIMLKLKKNSTLDIIKFVSYYL